MRAGALTRLGAMAAIVLVAACTPSSDPADPTQSPTPAPTPVSDSILMLVQVQDRTGYATGNALMATDPDGPVSTRIAYLPPSLLVPREPDSESTSGLQPRMTLGASANDPDTLAAWQSSRAAFDLDIDGSWTLGRLAFAGLVDAVGGVIIEVPQTITVRGDEPDEVIVIDAGRQRLDGIAAANYATAVIPGEPEDASLQRFRDVWIAVLARLPAGPERLRQIITSLGALAQTTLSVDELVSSLEVARIGVLDRTVEEVFVPTVIIRGGVRPASVMTPEGSRTVASMFADFPREPAPSDSGSSS